MIPLPIKALGVSFILASASGARAEVALSVDASHPVRAVDDRLFGLNTAVWDWHFHDAQSVAALEELHTPFLRFPGGSTSDVYHWQTNTDDAGNTPFATDFDSFADVALGLGSQAVITVNYGTGTPEEAADWVRYSNVEQIYGFKYWEIGNECYGSWEADKQAVPHEAYTYAIRTAAYFKAMKAADPSIKIGVVAQASEDGDSNGYTSHPATNRRTGAAHTGWTPVVLTTLRDLGVTPDFLIYHRYDQAPGKEDDAKLLQSSLTWPKDAAALRQLLSDYLGAAGAGVELIVTEDNQVYSDPGKQSVSVVNALFMADSTANVMQTEFNGLVWWDFHNGQLTTNNNSASLYGWRQYGDYGIESPDHDRYPTFYTAKLLSLFARGGDTVIAASSDSKLLSAYAVRRTDGSLAVLVINKSPTQTLEAKISVGGFLPGPSAKVYSYGIAQDSASRTGSGSPDIAQSELSIAGAGFGASFGPYTETVICLSAPHGSY